MSQAELTADAPPEQTNGNGNGRAARPRKPAPAKRIKAVEAFVAENLADDELVDGEVPENALMRKVVLLGDEVEQLTEEIAERDEADEQAAMFPVESDSLGDFIPHLRRPFTAEAVGFKVQATWGGGEGQAPTDGMVVTYIDARLAGERLNLVCPDAWSPEYEPIPGGGLLCKLTVAGVTRPDMSDDYTGKGLYSDALKRAAVHFGVGVSVYAMPKIFLKVSDGHLRGKSSRKGKTAVLTDSGERRCRELYREWLASAERTFGKALDHGDSDESAGDYEADTPRRPHEPESAPDPAPAAASLTPTDAPATPEDELAVLLAEDSPLREKRQEANAGMTAIGAGVPQRLRELRGASDARGIDALVTRISNVADGAK